MRVQQVRGAMQRDGGFAGAGPSLHHHRLVESRADDAVLLRLNRRHDIGHLAGALGVQRRQQRALAGERAVGRGLPDLVGVHVEHLVLHADDLAEPQRDMASHHDVAMVRRRRLIERARGVGAPIGEDRLMTLVRQSDTADIAVLALNVVESAEHQAVLHRAQLGEAVLIHGGEGIPLGALRGRTVRSGCANGVEPGS